MIAMITLTVISTGALNSVHPASKHSKKNMGNIPLSCNISFNKQGFNQTKKFILIPQVQIKRFPDVLKPSFFIGTMHHPSPSI